MSTTLYISPTRVILGGGKFDTNNRYIRASASGIFPIPKSETFTIAAGGASPTHYVNWRWSSGIEAVEYNSGGTAATGTPTYTLVTL